MRIYLGGHLNYYHPEKARWLELTLDGPRPLRELLARAQIPEGEVALVVYQEANVDLQTLVVAQKDEVKLFPPVGGG